MKRTRQKPLVQIEDLNTPPALESTMPTLHRNIEALYAAPKKNSRLWLKVGVVTLFILVGLIVFSGVIYLKTRHQVRQMGTAQGQTEMTPAEMKVVLQRVSKLTLLPDESPIMATIINAQFLASQSEFYKDAQDGDKLLVFPRAQKAYIYSPARDLLVNSGPVIADDASPSSQIK